MGRKKALIEKFMIGFSIKFFVGKNFHRDSIILEVLNGKTPIEI